MLGRSTLTLTTELRANTTPCFLKTYTAGSTGSQPSLRPQLTSAVSVLCRSPLGGCKPLARLSPGLSHSHTALQGCPHSAVLPEQFLLFGLWSSVFPMLEKGFLRFSAPPARLRVLDGAPGDRGRGSAARRRRSPLRARLLLMRRTSHGFLKLGE